MDVPECVITNSMILSKGLPNFNTLYLETNQQEIVAQKMALKNSPSIALQILFVDFGAMQNQFQMALAGSP